MKEPIGKLLQSDEGILQEVLAVHADSLGTQVVSVPWLKVVRLHVSLIPRVGHVASG